MAHLSLRGAVEAERFAEAAWQRVVVPVADILISPAGRRDRQLLLGARVEVLEVAEGHAFVRAERDGHVGYMAEACLGPDAVATHWVAAPASHLYPAADIKQRELGRLSLGARVRVVAEHGRFVELDSGAFLFARHLRALGDWAQDPVAVAEGFLGTPYLWGGNSRDGIDCSGLVQAAQNACGIACPSDSDLQWAGFGQRLEPGVALRRGDLVFWKGHVALLSDPETILHSNGNAMSTCYEGLAAALLRIAAAEGPELGFKRV